MEFDFDAIDEEDSPFPEVRASVSNVDDPDMPALTVRMWIVGLFLCLVSGSLNVFFNFRQPAPGIVAFALLLIAHPFGKFLALVLPITTYRLPLPHLPTSWAPVPSETPLGRVPTFFRSVRTTLCTPACLEFSLNPGPWNIKEHVLVFMMANVAVTTPYALNAIVVAERYYGASASYWFALNLTISTQLIGFGIAGFTRRFLVWPASMVWPQNLVACTLLNTLHAEEEVSYDDGEDAPRPKYYMTRYKFFMIVFGGIFFWSFLPGFAFKALSYFSFICWAAPNNLPVNLFFGSASGLGMSVLTFDWAQISWIGSPLMVPWWAQVHVFVGFVLFFWILAPALYFSGAWAMWYFPFSINQPFDRYGNIYNVTRVLTADAKLDPVKYAEYSPLFLPTTYAITYLLAFALSTSVIVHTILYHGKALYAGVRRMKVEQDDIHAKLMRNYPEVPDWWYGCVFVLFFAIGIVAMEVWDTTLPVWGLLLSVLLPAVYVLPSGFIFAMTGQSASGFLCVLCLGFNLFALRSHSTSLLKFSLGHFLQATRSPT
jgi:OPT family small oligopeptide transporter